MGNPIILVFIGFIVGIYSGIMGLGGGTIMIPIMVLLLGFTQHQAVGTSLAVMIPPVTLPAVISLYRQGHVKLGVAGFIAVGVVIGSPLGAMLIKRWSDNSLKLVFGFVLVYIAGYTIFNTLGKDHMVRNMLLAGLISLITVGLYVGVRWIQPAA
jgi:uncharacterized protein